MEVKKNWEIKTETKKHILFAFLLALFYLANAADYFTTKIAIPLGAIELNPIANYLMDLNWNYVTLLKFIFPIIPTYILLEHYRNGNEIYSFITAGFLALVFSVVSINNLLVIMQILNHYNYI